MSARKISDLLAQRHAIFISECKMGKTPCPILDGWAMDPSWAHPATYGYEIKVSRGDWLGDAKWPSYLEACNYFSFVCPSGLIQVSEVPHDVGLLWVSKTWTRVYTKKKAPWRDVPLHRGVVQYILQSRIRITRDWKGAADARAYWEGWLRDKALKRKLGYEVSQAIREHVRALEDENKKLRGEASAADEVRAWLEAQGLHLDTYSPSWQLRKMAEEVKAGMPHGLESTIEGAIRGLERFQRQLEGKRT